MNVNGSLTKLCNIMRQSFSLLRSSVFIRLFSKSKMSDITGSCGLAAATIMSSKEDDVSLVTPIEGMQSHLSRDAMQVVPCIAHTQAKTGGIETISKNALKRMKRWELKKQHKQKSRGEQNKDEKAELNVEKRPVANGSGAVTDVIPEDNLCETDYFFEGGLRKVYPYYYQFTTHAKGRWYGQKLVDIFTQEFRDYTIEQCQQSILDGRITVNGKSTDIQHILKNGDFITNKVHRHELPVTSEPLEIVEDNESFVVVNKPSSIPIHPCGRYRYNSIIYILAKEHGYRNLRGIYRLDRLTSGVLIFCKTEEKTREMMKLIKDRNVKKEYVCRVDGQFPSTPVECTEPIDVLSHKLGVYRCGPNGKESKTSFELICTDGRTSVVRCHPHTGRTHQIRLHLQFLGFPITNDPVYNDDLWGPSRGKDGNFGKSDEELIADLERKHTYKNHLDLMTGVVEGVEGVDSLVSSHANVANVDHDDLFHESPVTKRTRRDDTVSTSPSRQSTKLSYDKECRECQLRFRDPSPDQLVMYLHALRYQGPDWSFSTRLPTWAEPDWKGSL